MSIDYTMLMQLINAEVGKKMLRNSSNLNNKLTSMFPITFASPRIKYLLGISQIPAGSDVGVGETLNLEYCPSSAGTPFIVIDTNLSTELYTGFPKRLSAGSIGSVTPNMYMQSSPFSLDGFSLNNVSCNTVMNLKFTIRDIDGEPMRFESLLKWTNTIF
jgi:hypothetical protein